MKNLVMMSQFGRWGRAGNQMFQYMFLKLYARKHDLDLQIPSWVGNTLFGSSDYPVTTTLPAWQEPGSGLEHPTPPNDKELVDHDFRGYAQYHTSYYAKHRIEICELLTPTKQVYNRLHEASCDLGRGTKTSVGIHIRRGDYGRNIFPLVPVDWYLRWLKCHKERLGSLRLFIATEDPSLVEAFAEYHPVTAQSLGIEPQKQPEQSGDLPLDRETNNILAGDWYPDFYLLSECDIILGGSTTFSFLAAMLAPLLQEYWRASLAAETFVSIDPWNAFPMLREHCRDYAHLEGITCPPGTNRYW